MELKTDVTISKEELIEMIKEKYQIDGDFEFIINERSRMRGDFLVAENYFDGVKIKKNTTT